MKEYNDEEQGIVKLKNPWCNVVIPRSDIPEKRAIPASMLRKFFNVVLIVVDSLTLLWSSVRM